MIAPRRELAAVALTVLGLAVGVAGASTPAGHTVTVPSAAGQTLTVTWSGTIPPSVGPTNSCTPLPAALTDPHDVTINVPAGLYDTVTAQFTFQITWTPVTNINTSDEILTVIDPDGNEVGSSDGGTPSETVSAADLQAGAYKVVACGFANAQPQPYSGKLTIATSAAEASIPSAPAQGLEFSAAVPADNQRDEAEPLVEIDGDGNIYTCGPTGFSNASDYAQVSTDNGNQFHLLGEPPRGQQGAGGGGDCGLGTGNVRNAQGRFQYAYTGLGPLTGFVSSTSPNNGHNLTTGGPQAAGLTSEGGGADRQWNVFVDATTVLLSYNQQEPRNVVVQKSTDGGLTYSPLAAIAAPAPTFPGPMRYDAAHNVVMFGWDKRDGAPGGDAINLSVSFDKGATWFTCRAATAPVDAAGFVTVDYDRDGNVYVAYAEKEHYHTYLTVLRQQNVSKCRNPSSSLTQPTTNPGFSTPVQVDRDAVRTTVFPWLTAGPEPGRVAVAFYGTESQGNPNVGTFDAAWNVYVNQSLNALAATPTFSQVRATTHPFHYDSICLNGLGCDLAVPPGDRSLADFFAIDYSPASKALGVVFNRTNKKPDEASGHIASPMFLIQTAGPSNGGGTIGPPTRPVVRTSSPDAADDAISAYSTLAPTPPPAQTNEPAGDFLSASVGPEIDLLDGTGIPNGGFTVTLEVASLSTADLTNTLARTGSGSLLWIWRFTNAYQDVAASARWNPVQGFTFGYNDYSTGATPCAAAGPGSSASEKCIVYPGGQPIEGDVDQSTGTIRYSVPRFLLRALSGPSGNGQRPSEVAAQAGSRFYDGTAFSLGNPLSPLQDVQSFLYPLDNTPAMDFVLPADGGGGGGGGGSDCKVTAGGSIVSGTEGRFSLNAHADLKGSVAYRDEASGIDFQATSITAVTCDDAAHGAHVEGVGKNKLSDESQTFQVDVVDNGEPGTADVFGIQFGSYAKSGNLTRGNVRIH
jgi:hypothetical protein